MPLILLDRDGVVVVNRPTNIKTVSDLELIPRAAEAIARLNGSGFTVAICTNQPEVARGVISKAQLDHVHDGLKEMLAQRGACIDLIVCCESDRKSPQLKPSGGMLRLAMDRYGADAAMTPFVGDQADDLKAAFHAGCKRVLVRTGLGRQTLARPLPHYVTPVSIHDDLYDAADAQIAGRL
jgi:D-glycero-D-manno-heptose 1,7-bisphosphate phosphatase